jgi:hypothetical protein
MPLAPYARVVLTVGLLVTLGTGAGLFLAPSSVGHSFAWTIRAPLTAAFVGAGYLAGAGFGLALALRSSIWPRVRVVVIAAFVLVTTNLATTIRFFHEFHLETGGALARLVAWSWLVVYVALPPVLAFVIADHERRSSRTGWNVEEPLTAFTRVMFSVSAVSFGVLGGWLFVQPRGALADHWPWKLPPVSAAIVATWLLTMATVFGWSVAERDWRRVRVVILPFAATAALHLVAAARLADTFTGSGTAIALYIIALAVVLGTLIGSALVQAWVTAANPSRQSCDGAFYDPAREHSTRRV